MDKPNIHPELQMQQMLQVDLLLRPANLTDLVPTWHGAPSQVEPKAKWAHLNSPPQEFNKTAAKEVMTKIPGQHTWLAIWPQPNPCKGKHGKTVETGAAAAIVSQQHIAVETLIAAETDLS